MARNKGLGKIGRQLVRISIIDCPLSLTQLLIVEGNMEVISDGRMREKNIYLSFPQWKFHLYHILSTFMPLKDMLISGPLKRTCHVNRLLMSHSDMSDFRKKFKCLSGLYSRASFCTNRKQFQSHKTSDSVCDRQLMGFRWCYRNFRCRREIGSE